MPYLNKKQLYKFERDTFMAALSFSGGLDHCHWKESALWLWRYYKGEISEEEFEKGYMEVRE